MSRSVRSRRESIQVPLHAATLGGIGARLEQVQRVIGVQLPRRLFRDDTTFDPQWAVNACRRLRVDPRWLLLGIQSRAAEAAIKFVRNNGTLPAGDELFELLAMLPENELTAGICRYCLCTDQFACPQGCSWLDENDTICSACLEALP